jgi:hypothetical protein
MALRAAVLAVTVLAVCGPAAAQDRTRQYLGLARATLENPITPAELEQAILSPAGVRDVGALFAKSMAAGPLLGSFPELGGEATLDRGALRLVEYPDPIHPVIRRMLELKGDPRALLDYLTGSTLGQQILATTGGLHAHLFQMTETRPTPEQRAVLDRILLNTAATHARTWTATPELQQAMIEKTDWRGRYVGFWHLHPPVRTDAGRAAGFEPSLEDMKIAVEKQQFLTFVFQPDGFDAWDLEPLSKAGRTDLSLARVIRYRSPEWAAKFGRAVAPGPRS